MIIDKLERMDDFTSQEKEIAKYILEKPTLIKTERAFDNRYRSFMKFRKLWHKFKKILNFYMVKYKILFTVCYQIVKI